MADKMTFDAQEISTEAVMTHQVTLSIVKAPPTEIKPGAFITINVRVTCPEKCNFKADKVQVIDHEGQVVKEVALIIPHGMDFETDPIVLKVPTLPGTYTWKAQYPEQEKEGICHLEASIPITFTTKTLHEPSIVVWDVSSTVVTKDLMKFKVGVKCSADCQLTEQAIDVFNQENTKVAQAKLGEVPWEDTGALYWTEVELRAPDLEGIYYWLVKFPEPKMGTPHLEAETAFSFRVVNPPECTVNVEVLDRKDRTRIEGASVILHPYRAKTDELGKARLEVTKGEYQLYVSGLGSYGSYQSRITVNQDTIIEVELENSPFIGD
ncbi:MAG: hypothetical protein AB7E31_15470 [Desulfitobacterium sp.]